ncbi:hypothetical protein TTHERM_00695770 (macronuclear) [Tetrahymena thermophila SB210]|uniref:Uncharacterized protein n=1 Tax=Tetrahymena thermophila (strain SB210) TaxID=312017 RepID=Q24C95_TETTS|nr:hypothetical protein TTHERM_00695770 [Tetrahymena thermophila SB210]EAS05343.2 hypothetical protein TTHERM_00695770 [Tetrahymena thermophila SB210]|eukprot:XP_001025588.2 hypothetical protein TTHERM_00695770 [Tetrahymena thermophila SB210]
MSSSKEFCDKCDSIKETDPQYETAKKLMMQQGCFQENKNLTDCLNLFHKDWRSCKNETDLLTKCIQNSKKQ